MLLPLVDLKSQYLSIQSEIDTAIAGVLKKTDFIQGQDVAAFEIEFASFMQNAESPLYCASCANGTDALYLTLRAMGIKAGDEVITTAHTFIATAEAILLAGATPVFVDIDPKTMLLDPKLLEQAITPRSKAVIAVHLYGQPCIMDEILSIAKKHHLLVIEDAAQAHGARWKGKPVGAWGDAACFSFYPGKNLGCYGDGGAVVSKNQFLIQQIRQLANHGRAEKYEHLVPGVNSRLDTLQAAILRVKLKHLEKWNQLRAKWASHYLQLLSNTDLLLPYIDPHAHSVWHLFVIRSPRRDELLQSLREQGIQAGIHYPIPLHLQPALKGLGYRRGDLPHSEQAAAEVLSLPLYPELTLEQVEKVAEALKTLCYV